MVGVLVGEEDGVQPVDLGVEQLLAQVGQVSTSTRVTPAPLRRSTSSDVRRRRFLGLPGSQAPQPRAGRGTPPEEPNRGS